MKSVFVMLGLLLCTEAAGSRSVVVRTGEDLLLELNKDALARAYWRYQNSPSVEWRFKGNTLFTFSPSTFYKFSGRVELENFSVKLKNLQISDSGDYTAVVERSYYSFDVITVYRVTVKDPVSPVKLTVDSVTNSPDSCDLTVTCRSLDSHHISTNITCGIIACRRKGRGKLKSPFSSGAFHVYLQKDMIICNYSNQVSWTNATMNIRDVCPQNLTAIIIGSSVSATVLLGLILCVVLHKKCKKRDRDCGHTLTLEELAAAQTQSDREDYIATTFGVVSHWTR